MKVAKPDYIVVDLLREGKPVTTASTDIGPFSIVPRWVADACKGQPLSLAIYVWLADHADRRDAGFTIGRDEIAEAIGVGRSTANRALAVLVREGAITVVAQRSGVHQGWSRFHVHQANPQRPAAEPQTSQRPAGGPVQRPAGGPVSHEPHIENPNTVAFLAREEVFEKFWKAYPRKTAKKDARRAFIAAVKRGHMEAVRLGLRNHLPLWATLEPRFVPHAATWLNGERYLDVIQAANLPDARPTYRRFLRDDGTPYWVDAQNNEYDEDPNA